MSQVLGDDHYKRILRVPVGVTPVEPSLLNDHEFRIFIIEILKPFTGNGEVSIEGKIIELSIKSQTNKIKYARKHVLLK